MASLASLESACFVHHYDTQCSVFDCCICWLRGYKQGCNAGADLSKEEVSLLLEAMVIVSGCPCCSKFMSQTNACFEQRQNVT